MKAFMNYLENFYQKNIIFIRRFSGAAGIIAAEKRKATMVLGTPTMFIDILNSPILPKHDLSALKYAVLGKDEKPMIVKDS